MKYVQYFLLLGAAQFFVAILGGYSSVKNDVGEELNFSISFFGVIDMLSMIGRLVASFFLVVFPPSKINKTFFLSTVLQTLSILLVISAHFAKDLSKPFWLIGMLGFGLGRGIYAFPYLLLAPIFNKPEDVCAVNVWFGLLNVGDLYAYLLYIWWK